MGHTQFLCWYSCYTVFCRYIMFVKLYYCDCSGDRGPHVACGSHVGEPWSKRPKHVAYSDETTKLCCGWRQCACGLCYGIAQRGQLHKVMDKWWIKRYLNAVSVDFIAVFPTTIEQQFTKMSCLDRQLSLRPILFNRVSGTNFVKTEWSISYMRLVQGETQHT
jgi:hypothetical protein